MRLAFNNECEEYIYIYIYVYIYWRKLLYVSYLNNSNKKAGTRIK